MTKYPTYFVDIDGTIFKYRKFSDLTITNPEPIQNVIDKVNSEYNNGAHIVITTARPLDLELFTKIELEVLGVKYHQIIFGLGRGTRYVINDKDPEYPDVDRAVGINLNRNEGLCM
jgi:hypothetical protein